MRIRYQRPDLNRQEADAIKGESVQEEIKRDQTDAKVKAEAAAADVAAEGLYPPTRLAQAYVIWQKYGTIFSPAEALEKGTVFPELYSPYPY